jgi:hypothetical protein
MSSDETQSPLARAYDLVEAGDLEEARTLLESILDADGENADAWWIYAHAVTDPEAGRNALENVLSIDPTYPGASELLAQAEEMTPPKPKISPIAPVTMPETPGGRPEDEFPEPTAVASKPTPRKQTQAPSAPPRRSPVPVLAIVAIIAVALVLLVLLLQTGGTPLATATPTEVAEALVTPTEAVVAVVTEEPTQSSPPTEIMPTEMPTAASQPATAESAAVDYTAIEAALSEFPIAESGVGIVDTSLGTTLMVSACTTPGRAMRTLLPQVMNALAGQSPSLGSDVVAVGARMLDCTENAPLVTVATDLASAQNYAQGGLSDSEFAATWKPQ